MTRWTYEAAERRMWRDAFCAALGDPEMSVISAGKVADTALEEWRKRYPAPSVDYVPPQDETQGKTHYRITGEPGTPRLFMSPGDTEAKQCRRCSRISTQSLDAGDVCAEGRNFHEFVPMRAAESESRWSTFTPNELKLLAGAVKDSAEARMVDRAPTQEDFWHHQACVAMKQEIDRYVQSQPGDPVAANPAQPRAALDDSDPVSAGVAPHRFIPVTGNRFCGYCGGGKDHAIHQEAQPDAR